jgi:hypothetical protein
MTGQETDPKNQGTQQDQEPQQELSSEELMEQARLEELETQGFGQEAADESEDGGEPGDTGQGTEPAGDSGQQALQPEGGEGEEGKYPIVYQGQTYYVTPEEYQRMAFKGFDYDSKIGPHQKIIQLFQNDQGAQQVLRDYLQGRIKPGQQQQPQQPQQTAPQSEQFKVPKLEDFNSEEEWLDAVLQKRDEWKERQMQARQAAPPQQAQAPLNPPPARGQTIGDILRQRDPANYDQIMPQVEREALNLPAGEYQQLQQDPVKTAQFYDQVKQRLMGGQSAPQGGQQNLDVPPPPAPGQLPTSKRKPPKPSFRARSKGGESPQPKDQRGDPWSGSDEEHRKFMESIKGTVF